MAAVARLYKARMDKHALGFDEAVAVILDAVCFRAH
jgi:hypothetical protein